MSLVGIIEEVREDWLYYDQQARLAQMNGYSLHDSLAQWKHFWDQYSLRALNSHRDPTEDWDSSGRVTLQNKLRRYCKLVKEGSYGRFGRSLEYWTVHCDDISTVVTDPRKFEGFCARMRDETFSGTEAQRNGGILRMWTLPADHPYTQKYTVKQQVGELKYFSVESPDGLPSHLPVPRDSVEPFYETHSLRNTDEVHFGELRMTDEIVVQVKRERCTDSPVMKHEPEDMSFSQSLWRDSLASTA